MALTQDGSAFVDEDLNMKQTLLILNTEIARLSYMTNGRIGRDWRTHMPFVTADKGSEWDALVSAIDALRAARAEIERHDL